MANISEVINSLQYHKLDREDQETADAFEDLRDGAITFANVIHDLTPESREQSLAYTHLEETLMWAIKSIAIRM